MSTRPDPEISSAVEISTWRRPRLRDVWGFCKLSHQQKTRLWSLPARPGPVTVHPTRWGVRLHMLRMCDDCAKLYVLRTYVTRVIPFYLFLNFRCMCSCLFMLAVLVCGSSECGMCVGQMPAAVFRALNPRKRHYRGHVRIAVRCLALSFLMLFAIRFVIFIAHMPYNIV